jgi:hypothetical protein
MPVVTPMPMPYFYGTDGKGQPLENGYVRFFQSGTAVLQLVYQDALGLVPHPDPMPLNSAGIAWVFFEANKAYKMQLFDSGMNFVREADFLTAVPTLNADLDLNGEYGEGITGLDSVYFEDGGGGGTPGKWYRTDSDVAGKSSSAVLSGVATTTGLIGETKPIRVIGRISGFIGLVAGTTYYAGPAPGSITAVAPANARVVGVAESATTMILGPSRPGQLAVGQQALDFFIASGPASVARLPGAGLPLRYPRINAAATGGELAIPTAGVHDMPFPAAAFVPRSTNGCGYHERIVVGSGEMIGLPFDAVTMEYAFLVAMLPKSYNEGNITAEVLWANKAGGAGTTEWSVHITAKGHNESINTPFAAGTTPASAALAANTITKTGVTGAFTPGNTPAVGDLYEIMVSRNTAGADTYGSDAYLLGIRLFVTTDAENDA